MLSAPAREEAMKQKIAVSVLVRLRLRRRTGGRSTANAEKSMETDRRRYRLVNS